MQSCAYSLFCRSLSCLHPPTITIISLNFPVFSPHIFLCRLWRNRMSGGHFFPPTLVSVPGQQANIINIQNLYPKISGFLIKSHITFPCVCQLYNHPPSPPNLPFISLQEGGVTIWFGLVTDQEESRLYFCSLQRNQSMQTCRIHLGFSPCGTCQRGAVGTSASTRVFVPFRWIDDRD